MNIIEKAALGDSESLSALYGRNMGLIVKIAKRYAWQGVGVFDTDDLRQCAWIAVKEAAEGFDPSKGVPFISYLSLILKRTFEKEIRNNARVTQSKGAWERERVYWAVYCKLKKAGDEPTDELIAKAAGWGVETARKTAAAAWAVKLALKDDRQEADEGYYIDDGFSLVEEEQYKTWFWNAVESALTPIEFAVIRLRFKRRLSFDEISRKLNMTATKAGRVNQRALEKLRRNAAIMELKP